MNSSTPTFLSNNKNETEKKPKARRLSATYGKVFNEGPSSQEKVGEYFDQSGNRITLLEEEANLAKLYDFARKEIDCAHDSRDSQYHEKDMEEADNAVKKCVDYYKTIVRNVSSRPAKNIKIRWNKAIENLESMLLAIESDEQFNVLLLAIDGDKIFNLILSKLLSDEE
ncbi:hypothetical protein BD408DRAFT_404222 [Parasitella parasitica]|nr:hypothetical protein BD408DRAFT_404222 [Parasitella parasitica]